MLLRAVVVAFATSCPKANGSNVIHYVFICFTHGAIAVTKAKTSGFTATIFPAQLSVALVVHATSFHLCLAEA
jgi:hypothetical protein